VDSVFACFMRVVVLQLVDCCHCDWMIVWLFLLWLASAFE